MTKTKYTEVSVTSPIFAIDCEMCKTSKDNQELTRIAIINEKLEVRFVQFYFILVNDTKHSLMLLNLICNFSS